MMTCAIEKLDDCLPEMKALFEAHWEELAICKEKMPLAPRYETYYAREAMGELVMPILREEGKIVGYWPTFIAYGLHYGTTLTATMDILWIKPEKRGGMGAKMLYHVLKGELKKRGVQMWYAGSKDHKQIEWFLQALGFVPFERYFFQWIGD